MARARVSSAAPASRAASRQVVSARDGSGRGASASDAWRLAGGLRVHERERSSHARVRVRRARAFAFGRPLKKRTALLWTGISALWNARR